MAASIASRTANVSAERLELAFQAGVWSTQRGLDHARRLTDPASRVAALVCVARYCGEAEQGPVLAEALAAVSIADDETQAATLTSLVPHLPPELLPEALDTATAIGSPRRQAEALAALAPHLPPELLERALAAARALRSDSGRAAALTGLAPHLPATRQRAVLAQALEAATRVTEDRNRAAALTGLVPYLPPDMMATVLESAVGISAEVTRGTVLADLARQLPPALLARALGVADDLTGSARANALAGLAPCLPADQQPAVLTRALEAALGIADDHLRSSGLAGLAPELPPALLDQALDAVVAVADDESRRGAGPHGAAAAARPARPGAGRRYGA